MPTAFRVFVIFGGEVVHMNCPAIKYGPASYRVPAHRQSLERMTCRRNVPIGSNVPKQVAFEPEDHGIISLTEACGIFPYCIQDRLNVGWGAGDNLEHLADCSLLLQRFAQLTGAVLLGLEQPDVLDRDHRLIGERRDELYLFVRKRFDDRAT